MHLFTLVKLWAYLCHLPVTLSYQNLSWDLATYVSRPDIRPPRFRVEVFKPDEVDRGYWFVSPYANLRARPSSSIYIPGQDGPHIYDNRGGLIWSGAHLFERRTKSDFKLSCSNTGEPSLTFIVVGDEQENDEQGGLGVTLDNSFNIRKTTHVNSGARTVDMHEYTVLSGAKTTLTLTSQSRYYNSKGTKFSGWINDMAVVEADIASGETIFEWWASDHVNPFESVLQPPLRTRRGAPWDCFHLNSIDKDDQGNYLISARHTSTIYKVSGTDGSIIWRLGGKHDSFGQKDFNFSFQHDARVVSNSGENTTITLLNNDSQGESSMQNADWSTALTVALVTSTKPMTASLKQSLIRPDGKLTTQRGNVQKLRSNNTFVCWGENSYISEFSEEGELIYTAQFETHRFATYRAYKFDFIGKPKDPPDIKCSAYGVSASAATTVCHVSWNGATEVRYWNFWTLTQNEDSDSRKENHRLLGTSKMTGFETMLMVQEYFPLVFAEAVDENKRVIGKSALVRTILPKRAEDWNRLNFKADEKNQDQNLHPGDQNATQFNRLHVTNTGDEVLVFDGTHGSCYVFSLSQIFASAALGAASVFFIQYVSRYFWDYSVKSIP